METLRLSSPGQPLLAVGHLTTLPDGTPVKRFKRAAIQIGQTYRKAGWKQPLVVSEDRAAKWLSNFDTMKSNGIPLKVTRDHKPYTLAENCMGDLVSMKREGAWLTVEMDVRGQKNIDIAEQNKDVSVEIYPSVKDGRGREYFDAIPAVTFTGCPVVDSQPIAASMAADSTYYLSTEPDMNPLYEKLAQLLSLKADDVTDANALTHLATLGTALETAKKIATDAQAEVQRLSLEEKPDLKYLALSAKLSEQELKHAVEQGVLQQSCADEIKLLCIGERDKSVYSPLMLSMGEDATGLVERLIGIIRKNKPVKSGEQTPAQKLSREVPDANNEAPKEVVSPFTGNKVSLAPQ